MTVHFWRLFVIDFSTEQLNQFNKFLGLNTAEGGARVSIMQFSGKSGINKQSAFNRKDYFSYLGKDRVVDFNFVTKNSKEALMRKIGKFSKKNRVSRPATRDWSTWIEISLCE